MKTTTALIALFSALSIPASTLAQQLSVGARGGYVRSTISWDGTEQVETSWNPNFHIGAVSRLEIHRNFALSAGKRAPLLFSTYHTSSCSAKFR